MSLILRTVLTPVLKTGFRQKNSTITFQNIDDMHLIIEKNITTPADAVLIKGSGVHLNDFKPDQKQEGDLPIVFMPTRLVRQKGISVFVEAAKMLKAENIEARFQIAGGVVDHPNAISKDEMTELTRDGVVEWLGFVSDISDRLAQADIIVYPSYYGEGVPRVLLEACAAGRAIVTTDHPGCREAVDDGKNGLLVPIKDPVATANAIKDILCDDALRVRMEKQSRNKAEQEFDIRLVVLKTVQLYGT